MNKALIIGVNVLLIILFIYFVIKRPELFMEKFQNDDSNEESEMDDNDMNDDMNDDMNNDMNNDSLDSEMNDMNFIDDQMDEQLYEESYEEQQVLDREDDYLMNQDYSTSEDYLLSENQEYTFSDVLPHLKSSSLIEETSEDLDSEIENKVHLEKVNKMLSHDGDNIKLNNKNEFNNEYHKQGKQFIGKFDPLNTTSFGLSTHL